MLARLGFFCCAGLALIASSPLHALAMAWGDSANQAWWAANPTPDKWAAAAATLQGQLEADYKQNGAASFADADFRGWMEDLEWVRLGQGNADVVVAPQDLAAFVALGQDEAVSHLLVEKIDPLDDPKAALKNILRLAESNAADLHEYAALGVAYALVFDRPFPKTWPHRQVDRQAVPIGNLDVLERFEFYVQSNRNKKLDLDLTTLNFENLKYLVDSEVRLDELTYAQQNRIEYAHFADAFSSIQPDQGRLDSSQYDWPLATYGLADIEKNGGVSIDQAYYAVTLGKGRGIPTILFTGYSVDHAHAWFGYLSSSGKWELDCGRSEAQDAGKEGQEPARGYAIDPQTWEPIDDSVLEDFFKNSTTNPNYQPAVTALAWARLHSSDPSYAHILDDARSLMPEWPGTWKLQSDLVEKSGDLDKKKAFYQDWITQFGSFPEMKVEGQKRLYRDLLAAGDPGADDLLKDIIMQNRTEGFDLGIQAGADAMTAKCKAGDWDGAKESYERSIRDFGDQGGLTLFSKVISPFIKGCLANDKVNLAGDAVDFTQSRMTFEPNSQVGMEWLLLKNEVAARKLADH